MPSRPSYGLPRGSQVGPPAPGNARFDRPEFALAFDYPGQMRLRSDVHVGLRAGPPAPSEIELAVALDQRNGIMVEQRTLHVRVTDANFSEAKREGDEVMSQLAGVPVSGTEILAAGLPGLEYSFPIGNVPTQQSRYVVIFDGATEYLVFFAGLFAIPVAIIGLVLLLIGCILRRARH